MSMWRCPKMGDPPNHPFINGCSSINSSKPCIWGYSPPMETPKIHGRNGEMATSYSCLFTSQFHWRKAGGKSAGSPDPAIPKKIQKLGFPLHIYPTNSGKLRMHIHLVFGCASPMTCDSSPNGYKKPQEHLWVITNILVPIKSINCICPHSSENRGLPEKKNHMTSVFLCVESCLQ